jgi:hypothetical protein
MTRTAPTSLDTASNATLIRNTAQRLAAAAAYLCVPRFPDGWNRELRAYLTMGAEDQPFHKSPVVPGVIETQQSLGCIRSQHAATASGPGSPAARPSRQP